MRASLSFSRPQNRASACDDRQQHWIEALQPRFALGSTNKLCWCLVVGLDLCVLITHSINCQSLHINYRDLQELLHQALHIGFHYPLVIHPSSSSTRIATRSSTSKVLIKCVSVLPQQGLTDCTEPTQNLVAEQFSILETASLLLYTLVEA